MELYHFTAISKKAFTAGSGAAEQYDVGNVRSSAGSFMFMDTESHRQINYKGMAARFECTLQNRQSTTPTNIRTDSRTQ